MPNAEIVARIHLVAYRMRAELDIVAPGQFFSHRSVGHNVSGRLPVVNRALAVIADAVVAVTPVSWASRIEVVLLGTGTPRPERPRWNVIVPCEARLRFSAPAPLRHQARHAR